MGIRSRDAVVAAIALLGSCGDGGDGNPFDAAGMDAVTSSPGGADGGGASDAGSSRSGADDFGSTPVGPPSVAPRDAAADSALRATSTTRPPLGTFATFRPAVRRPCTGTSETATRCT